jgi:hypothetical protein
MTRAQIGERNVGGGIRRRNVGGRQLYIQSRPERLTAIPTSKDIHEARIIRDAEMAEPQTTIALKRGDEKLH